jgi:hypothetical protein
MNSRANLKDQTNILPPEPAARRAWYGFGLWLRVLIIGVGAAATGVALLLERTSALTPAVGYLVGGAILTAFAWLRGAAALRRVDGPHEAGNLSASTGQPQATHDAESVGRVGPFGQYAAARAIE